MVYLPLSTLLYTSMKKQVNSKFNKRKSTENKAGRKAILVGTADHDGHLVDKEQDKLAKKLKAGKRKQRDGIDKTDNNQQVVKRQRQLLL